MSDQEIDSLQDAKEKDAPDLKFECPNCGKIAQADVLFLCNTCPQSELIEREGVYMCPSCFKPGDNFECMLCGSKQVKLLTKFPRKNA